LGTTAFVACQDHRNPLRQQQGRHQVAHLLAAQLQHFRVSRRTFRTAIPTVVVVVTIRIVVLIRLAFVTTEAGGAA
jgi:hypothetical protein